MSNPYFAYSAIMMAAFDGIINKIDPKEAGYGPYDINLYDLAPEELSKIGSLPTSLQEAADALKEDYDYLLAGDVFTKNMIKNHIKQIEKDHALINKMPHPFEFQLYYNQ